MLGAASVLVHAGLWSVVGGGFHTSDPWRDWRERGSGSPPPTHWADQGCPLAPSGVATKKIVFHYRRSCRGGV